MWAGNFTGGESARKWGSGHYSQMTRDRTHRPVHRVNADSVHPLLRRGQRVGSSSIPAAVGAVTSEVGSGSATSEPPTKGLGVSRAGRPVPHVHRGYLEHVCGARRSRRAGPPQSVSAPASALAPCRAVHCAQPVDNRLAPHESGDQSRVLIANLLSTCTTRGGHVLPAHHRLTTPTAVS